MLLAAHSDALLVAKEERAGGAATPPLASASGLRVRFQRWSARRWLGMARGDLLVGLLGATTPAPILTVQWLFLLRWPTQDIAIAYSVSGRLPHPGTLALPKPRAAPSALGR